jgi:hypothetical protein
MMNAGRIRRHGEFLRATGASVTTSVATVFIALQPEMTERIVLITLMFLWAMAALRLRSSFSRARGDVGGEELQQFSRAMAQLFSVRPMTVRVEEGHPGLATLEGHARTRRITVDAVIVEDDELCLSTLGHEYAHLRLRHHRGAVLRVALTLSPLLLSLTALPPAFLGAPVFLLCLSLEALGMRKMRNDEYAADVEALRVIGPAYLPGAGRLLGDDVWRHRTWSTHPADGLRRRKLDLELRRIELRNGPLT